MIGYIVVDKDTNRIVESFIWLDGEGRDSDKLPKRKGCKVIELNNYDNNINYLDYKYVQGELVYIEPITRPDMTEPTISKSEFDKLSRKEKDELLYNKLIGN